METHGGHGMRMTDARGTYGWFLVELAVDFAIMYLAMYTMIPHHSGAILMCEQASLTDPEIKELCGQIVPAQRQEIERMRRILERY